MKVSLSFRAASLYRERCMAARTIPSPTMEAYLTSHSWETVEVVGDRGWKSRFLTTGGVILPSYVVSFIKNDTRFGKRGCLRCGTLFESPAEECPRCGNKTYHEFEDYLLEQWQVPYLWDEVSRSLLIPRDHPIPEVVNTPWGPRPVVSSPTTGVIFFDAPKGKGGLCSASRITPELVTMSMPWGKSSFIYGPETVDKLERVHRIA